MLTELSVENFALVERLRLRFGPGLNLLTGETGAGKSILLGALGMVLGERTGADIVRHGAEKARVEAVFTLEGEDSRLQAALEVAGVEADDGQLLLSREVTAAGKSAARINGRPATAGMLRTLGDALVDIHSQHEHQSLMDTGRHQELLDAWSGPEMTRLREAVTLAHGMAQTAVRRLADLQHDARERARTIDLLSFQRAEIDKADPKPEEEEALIAEQTRLASAERLRNATESAYVALHGGGKAKASVRGGLFADDPSGGALQGLASAVSEIEHAVKWDDRLAPLLESLQGALYATEEAARDVRAYRDGVEADPARLEEIETRLDTLKTLRRKYGETIPDVLAYRDEISAKLETLENAEERIAALQGEVEKTRKVLESSAAALTRARKKAAEPFAKAILRELSDLAMSATRFSVAIEPRGEPTATGADRVEFLISPNPGEPLKPLVKIASGGEMSRVMLAMKSVLVRTIAVTILVFDEIDSGIGGRTGTVLAEKLSALAATSQVLCITHLPQIAARGGTHFTIEKRTAAGRTAIHVAPLDGEARVGEIARMLGGAHVSETVLQHAREMLGQDVLGAGMLTAPQ
jgi:DNA repair protein RecN (Recombination protein N)